MVAHMDMVMAGGRRSARAEKAEDRIPKPKKPEPKLKKSELKKSKIYMG
jgi:hypothetical protein